MTKGNCLTRLLYCLFLMVLVISCAKEEGEKLVKLNYGTSFNMCIGYCKKSMAIDSHNITYNRSGWVNTIETITCKEVLENNDWIFFNKQLDISAFLKLQETIGCPDCADGGAEWIEIEQVNGNKHKVTFEFMHEPSQMKGYIDKLRELAGRSEHCGEY